MGLIAEQIKQGLSTRNVGIVEFSESSDFCGKPLYPRQRVLLKLIFLEEMEGWEEDVLSEWMQDGGEVLISPYIRERRDYLRDHGYRHFPETILVGGRRSSKGHITGLALAKKMYDVWRLGDPGKHFEMDPDKTIFISCIATSEQQAKEHQFGDLVSSVTRCRAMGTGKVQELSVSIPTLADKQYMIQMKNRGIKIGKDWSKIKGVPLAANADTIRGSATIATVFDEMSFMMEGQSRSSAAECYDALTPSLDQFGQWAMIFCNSSPATKVGKFYELWANSHMVRDNSPMYNLMFSIQFPSWELYRDYEKATWHHFNHAISVSPDQDLSKLSPEDADIARKLREEEQQNPEKFKVERRGQWAEVQDAYLNPDAVDAAYLENFQGTPISMNRTGGSYVYLYKAHCDPSSTTAGFGFAIAHTEYFKKVAYDDQKRPFVTDIDEPHIVFDVVQRWDPADFDNHTIDWQMVIDEIASYCERFPSMRELSFDQYQSVNPVQTLQRMLYERGLNINVSIKTATNALNWNRWEAFKTVLNQRRVHIPPNCPDSNYSKLELKFLHIKNGRVDHQTLGPVQTKDISDAICECVYYLINNVEGWGENNERFPVEFGLQGGYQIGKYGGSYNDAMKDIYRSLRPNNTMSSRSAFRNRRRY
jgi:hypothetical protein